MWKKLPEEAVKKVIIVSKTHLDVGFTNYAEEVLRNYVMSFIPKAVDTAFSLNTPDKKRFVWTTGSWLIRYALRHSNAENAAKLREAIRLGYVRYHALPLTTHSELMSRELFRYGISLARELDREFGLHTVAAKMTDVPGHTRAIVPLMAEADIRYLHLGVNGASRVPNTPPIFRWRSEGCEVAVSYSGDYGTPLVLPNGIALEMLHTHDNFGPPTVEEISDFYATLMVRYPNAELCAGTLDDFAEAVEGVWNDLPVVEEEIGDTWIHGGATDPVKTSKLRRLEALVERWLGDGSLNPGSQVTDRVMDNLLLTAEHTWGMDVKKYLLDFKNWRKQDFLAALERDETDYSSYGECNRHIFEKMKPELDAFRGANPVSTYSGFERSHAEQRAYLENAVSALPRGLAAVAKRELAWSYPVGEKKAPFVPNVPVKAGPWEAVFDASGTLVHLKNEARGVDRSLRAGEFGYESFSGETVKQCYYNYGRDLDINYHWAEPDFGKPGLEFCPEVKDGFWHAVPVAAELLHNRYTIFLTGDPDACEDYGCPRELAICWEFGVESIDVTLYWRGKDPIRSPEALWFGFNMNSSNPRRTRMQKLGCAIDPGEVLSGGNRKLHSVERISCCAAMDSYTVTPKDSPLVSVGGRHLYHTDDRIEDPGMGMWFLLCNNRWGTNFPQWFREDCRFSYTLKLEGREYAVKQKDYCGK